MLEKFLQQLERLMKVPVFIVNREADRDATIQDLSLLCLPNFPKNKTLSISQKGDWNYKLWIFKREHVKVNRNSSFTGLWFRISSLIFYLISIRTQSSKLTNEICKIILFFCWKIEPLSFENTLFLTCVFILKSNAGGGLQLPLWGRENIFTQKDTRRYQMKILLRKISIRLLGRKWRWSEAYFSRHSTWMNLPQSELGHCRGRDNFTSLNSRGGLNSKISAILLNSILRMKL